LGRRYWVVHSPQAQYVCELLTDYAELTVRAGGRSLSMCE